MSHHTLQKIVPFSVCVKGNPYVRKHVKHLIGCVSPDNIENMSCCRFSLRILSGFLCYLTVSLDADWETLFFAVISARLS